MSAIQSLTADYGDDSDEESAVDKISDEDNVPSPMSVLPVLHEDNSNSSSVQSARGDHSSSVQSAKRTTKLVSYGPDEHEEVEDDDSENDMDLEESEFMDMKKTGEEQKKLDAQDASALSRTVRNMSADEIQIPASPPGRCSKDLQEKITLNYDRMIKSGYSNNVMIQRRKDFRNPSIYEKLIEYLHIDEKGTNFPPDIFNPQMWTKESLYDELDKVQKKEMEKREKERKERIKIDFIVGAKKSSSLTDNSGPDDKKRKTKWDSQPSRSANIPIPAVVTLTATGTKSTVISAVGSISKKSAQK